VPSVEQQLAMLSLTPEPIRTAWPLFLESFGDSLLPGGRALGERIIRHLDGILAAFAKGTRTLVHFDYRADNLFIAAASARRSAAGITRKPSSAGTGGWWQVG
jgi:hypothetical protein